VALKPRGPPAAGPSGTPEPLPGPLLPARHPQAKAINRQRFELVRYQTLEPGIFTGARTAWSGDGGAVQTPTAPKAKSDWWGDPSAPARCAKRLVVVSPRGRAGARGGAR